ncbi:MAG: DUF4974 domain-containing protein [Candidatus Pedobacter colombiensis]|uniref:DUF4974 domain-containing protein n=1 Tax=Candidatus Pedobacter colombiensis TaxID=3121371 RepID=A0AAJ6B791_9SPHI|nr:FecR family protein [Pedobacter sp.]WEK20852.1 MAG: DUF4974 domain-containing protein [Pedobacter sp.]
MRETDKKKSKMDNKDPKDLLLKYRSGTCDEEERILVDNWYATYNMDVADVSFEEAEAARLEVFKLLPKPNRPNKNLLWSWLSGVAAVSLLIYGASTLFIKEKVPKPETYTNDIKPGSNKAILTLANGKTIDLSNAKNGELASDKGVEIIKKADGQLLYKFNPDAVHAVEPGLMDSLQLKVNGKLSPVKDAPGLNVMVTPKGGQYSIVLPDGTNVWINAGSTLRFPSSFWEMPERRVYLSGEAYFEVRQIKSVLNMQRRARKIPFIVQTDKQEITVLGTHFNINCYNDEPNIKTTLLEGLVKVSSKGGDAILKPGMQAINNGSTLQIAEVDTDLAIAWKNGEFAFINESLENIMKQVSRWYNVHVVYNDEQIKKKKFGAFVSKFKNVSELLHMIELNGEVKFKVQGNKITVMK